MGSESDGMSSKSLKFGVDRLLASDDKSRDDRERCSDLTPYDYQTSVEKQMTTVVPSHLRASCTECVNSFFRCCARMPHPHVYHPQYFNAPPIPTAFLHTPKPIRAYPSITLERDDRVNLGKRKRSWSRAVFSNLQRKGLEKRFQLQKYITKPDRRQLAATLGLTDAQVKVWFQNRRMKWRHTKELKYHVDSTTGTSSQKVQKQQQTRLLPESVPAEESPGVVLLVQDS